MGYNLVNVVDFLRTFDRIDRLILWSHCRQQSFASASLSSHPVAWSDLGHRCSSSFFELCLQSVPQATSFTSLGIMERRLDIDT